jgi:ribosomal protein S18 acetylase RimI-like enzyme
MSGSGSGARVREATPMDAGEIARVHVETWQSAYAGLVPDGYLAGLSVGRLEGWWRELLGRRKGETVLVALDEAGEIVGFGSCGRVREPREGATAPGVGGGRGGRADSGWRGEIYTLYVHPDAQEQGHGRALLVALMEELAAKGFVDAGLWMLAGNPTRFFYERMGGQAQAEREERFAGVWLPEVAYVWPDLFSWLSQVKQGQRREE